MSKRVLALLFLLALAPMSARGTVAATGFVIDDFETGNGVAVPGNNFLDGASILGGERDVVFLGVTSSFTVAGGTGTLGTVSGAMDPQRVIIYYDGNDDSTTVNYGLGSADLTMGGSFDRFEVEVLAITGSVSLLISVSESSGNSGNALQVVTAPGVVQIPFSSFSTIGTGADFASAERVDLVFLTLDDGESITIDNFQTIPEPGSALLVAAACGAGLVARRRREPPAALEAV